MIAPIVQGTFFATSGLWPIVHFRSFEAVTGAKKEPWLVKTMGALITAVGVALLVGARERSRAIKTLGIASALVLGGADLIFVARRQIAPSYLADAAAEAALVAMWLVSHRA